VLSHQLKAITSPLSPIREQPQWGPLLAVLDKHAAGASGSTRAAIDQAIGIIRSRSGLSAEAAFDRLTQFSQSENVKLHIVAEHLVEEAVRRARARQR